MILLNDVIGIFFLALENVNTGVNFDAFNGRRVGAALVDEDLLGTPCRLITLSK